MNDPRRGRPGPWLLVPAVPLGAALAVSLLAVNRWDTLPDQIPTHVSHGRVDQWSSKPEAVGGLLFGLLIPLVGAVISVSLRDQDRRTALVLAAGSAAVTVLVVWGITVVLTGHLGQ